MPAGRREVQAGMDPYRTESDWREPTQGRKREPGRRKRERERGKKEKERGEATGKAAGGPRLATIAVGRRN